MAAKKFPELFSVMQQLQKQRHSLERSLANAEKHFLREITKEARAVIKTYNASHESAHHCNDFTWEEFYPDRRARYSRAATRIVMEIDSLRRKSDKLLITELDLAFQKELVPSVTNDLNVLQTKLRRRLGFAVVVRLRAVELQFDPPGFY